MPKIEFSALREHVLTRLSRELPDELFYHGVHHTRDDVLPAAERLAQLANLNTVDSQLYLTAMLYHDIGYIEQYPANEPIAARIVGEELPDFGYSANEITIIQSIIMATALGAAPQTKLEQLATDADLDGLGRDDFFITSMTLRLELARRGTVINMRDWTSRQLKFLSEIHRYHTEEARSLREAGKQANIAEMRLLLGV
jgi:uncharacterized protein